MNLHQIASQVISAVNPMVPGTLQIAQPPSISANGKQTPNYATPLRFLGAIYNSELVIGEILAGGPVMLGQTVLGAGILPETTIVGMGTGVGGPGVYVVAPEQLVFQGNDAPQTAAALLPNQLLELSATMNIFAQVQPLAFKDTVQIESLNIGGYRRVIFINGHADALVRMDKKGGDLFILADGTVWLTAEVLEQWPDWVKVVATLQDGRSGVVLPNTQNQSGPVP